MFAFKFPVPADTAKVRIKLPNHDKVLSAGPLFVSLARLGQPQTFTETQGGPCSVTVLSVGKNRAGRRMVTLTLDAFASAEPVIICKA